VTRINLATNLLIAYLIYFVMTYLKMFINKDTRKSHQDMRLKFDVLRKISIKTPEQQKAFLDLKYPRKPFFQWTFMNILKVFLKLSFMILLFLITKKIWTRYLNIEFRLWQVILLIVIIPIILNLILKRYNLQQDDILVFFRNN
jgi:hypothetical protein